MSQLRAAALAYAERLGWAVFPLGPRKKIPLIAKEAGGNGCLDATRDLLQQIQMWWTRCPDANVGIATGTASGFFALDTDPRNGGEDTLAVLEDTHGALRETVVSLTGGGGRHLLFRYDPRLADVRWTPLGPGLDVKGDGGYIVVPPSIHPSGRSYAWEASSHPLHAEMAAAPEWLVAVLLTNPKGRAPAAGGPATTDPQAFRLGRLFHAGGMLGAEIRPGVWRVRCPNAGQHTCGEDYDGSTVLFAPGPGQSPGWLHCSHEHCRGAWPTSEDAAAAVEQASGVRLERPVARPPDNNQAGRVGGDGGNGGIAPRPGEDVGPIRVVLGTDEHRVNDEALAAMAGDASIYARGQRLVRVVEPRDGAPFIQDVPLASLRELLTRRVRFLRVVKGARKPAHPPDWCVAALVARADLPGVRPLVGIIVTPTLRPDGSVLDQPGYDESTGLLFAPSGPVCAVPAHPTREHARAAAKDLLEVVCDFPFALEAHRSAWLAAVLTLLVRHLIRGNVPAVLVDANARGSGKGLLVDTIAIITTGRPISRSPQPRDDDELRKHITSIARAGTPAALIDNITGKFTYRSFDAALTCEGRWADRILGQTARREWPLPTVWFLTSNNAALSSDTARRVLPIRLLSDAEQPEDRRDFAHSDLKSWIVGERPRLVCAALTILRAYHEAERPQTEMVPWGSFVEWGRMIRQCLVWLGLPDPVHARHELRERADVDRGAIATVLCEIEQCTRDGTAISAAELLEHSAGRAELRAAIDELSPPRAGVDLTAQRLGSLLRSLRDRVVDGLRLEGHIGHGGALRWRVREVHSSPEGVDRHHRHQRHQAAPLPGDDGDIGEDETRRGEADSCEKQPNGADVDVDANQPAPPPAHPPTCACHGCLAEEDVR